MGVEEILLCLEGFLAFRATASSLPKKLFLFFGVSDQQTSVGFVNSEKNEGF